MPTLPVPNQQAAIAEIRKNSAGKLLAYLIPPWNSWFQQFSQPAPAVVNVSTLSPFTANSNGTLILTGAGAITLTRGLVNINLTGERIIPIGIGDTVTWAGGTAQFLGA